MMEIVFIFFLILFYVGEIELKTKSPNPENLSTQVVEKTVSLLNKH